MNTLSFKKSLFALAIALVVVSCGEGSINNGQYETVMKKKYKTISVVPQTEYSLNGQSGSGFNANKKSRITFPFILPENTVEWYYVFSASQQNSTDDFNLSGQLASLIDQTGTLNFGTNRLTAPHGSDVCNVFVFLDKENRRFFKKFKNFEYLVDCSRTNIKSGTVKVPGFQELTGLKGGLEMYMGIDNPKDLKGISIGIEIVAIVLE